MGLVGFRYFTCCMLFRLRTQGLNLDTLVKWSLILSKVPYVRFWILRCSRVRQPGGVPRSVARLKMACFGGLGFGGLVEHYCLRRRAMPGPYSASGVLAVLATRRPTTSPAAGAVAASGATPLRLPEVQGATGGSPAHASAEEESSAVGLTSASMEGLQFVGGAAAAEMTGHGAAAALARGLPAAVAAASAPSMVAHGALAADPVVMVLQQGEGTGGDGAGGPAEAAEGAVEDGTTAASPDETLPARALGLAPVVVAQQPGWVDRFGVPIAPMDIVLVCGISPVRHPDGPAGVLVDLGLHG